MTSAEALLEGLGDGLGPWSYALVDGLVFLETSAFVGLIAPSELGVVLGGVLAGEGQVQLPVLLAVVWAAAVAGAGCTKRGQTPFGAHASGARHRVSPVRA